MEILKSELDASVNFVEQQLTGFIESRYVRRIPDYFIAYLSSQTGCNRGCKMCHLTATKQTHFENVTGIEFLQQFGSILKHYDQDAPAETVHINFMARGEPLCNPIITDDSFHLFQNIHLMAAARKLNTKFNISTIMPKTLDKRLVEMFPLITPTIYYSLYSIEDDFRKKWLPGAMHPYKALMLLKEYQDVSKKIIKFHGAFIKGENDNPMAIAQMMQTIEAFKIVGEFNIVRYNPLTEEQGAESEQLEFINFLISKWMPCKIIKRVGPDVKASCGQFVQ